MILELSYRDRNMLSFAERFSYTQILSPKQCKDTTDFFFNVVFLRTVGLQKFNSTWRTEGYQGSPFTVSKAEQKTAATFLYARFRANTAKHTAKPGKVQSASSGLATCYITGSFPLCPFLLKWVGVGGGDDLRKRTDIFMTSGALEMQT